MTFRKHPVKHGIEVLLALVLSSRVLHVGTNRARNFLVSNTTAEIMHGSMENSSITYKVSVPLDTNESQIITAATGSKAERLKLSPFTNRSEFPKSNQGYIRLPTNRTEFVEDRLDGIPGEGGMMPSGKPNAQVDMFPGIDEKSMFAHTVEPPIQWQPADSVEAYGSWATKLNVVIIFLVVVVIIHRYRRKIIALILEGRRPTPGDRRSNVRYSALTGSGDA